MKQHLFVNVYTVITGRGRYSMLIKLRCQGTWLALLNMMNVEGIDNETAAVLETLSVNLVLTPMFRYIVKLF
jgi:hypothetical protein